MRQRVLVHGAENFVGRAVTQALTASDWAEPVTVTSGDARALQAALGGTDAIAHCVAGDAARIESGSALLYDALSRHAGAPRVVHLSSMTVYGSTASNVDEKAGLRADLGPYSEAQRVAETTAASYANRVVLRPGVEYGPGCTQWSERVARWLIARRLGDLGAAGDGCCNLIFIGDLVKVIVATLRHPDIQGEVFNVACSSKPTWNEYFIAFGIALGAVPVKRITRRRLKIETRLLAPPLRIAQLLAGRTAIGHLVPPPIPPSLLRLCSQEIELNVAKIEQRLHLQWTPWQTGLQAAAESISAVSASPSA